MRVFLLLLFIALASAANHLDVLSIDPTPNWLKFKVNHIKKYIHETEETLRFNVFVDNLNKINLHNQRYEQGLENFKLGTNEFSDMFHSEFLRKMTGYAGVQNLTSKVSTTFDAFASKPTVSLPTSVNWTAMPNVVTPIKNQGQCGSCYTFSVTGALEGAYGIKFKKLIPLSEQNLIDCSSTTKYGNEGCNGGYPDKTLEYVINNAGINTAASYPYKSTAEKCKYNKANKAPVTPTRIMLVSSGSESALQAAVVMTPVAVAIDASRSSFQSYKSGVYSDPKCSSSTLNHAVLAVGYGSTTMNNKVLNYWIVKNSWGTSWGLNGYILIERNKNNMCGIATECLYPILA